ncbi:hypothetical protein LSUE1_G005616 [Lachnellula suecica]|uniref:C2H2-type domain-containing protein n=1 Tax=Lachnellula suecica TaxID=602035 RepID=A0A8T9C950_9HELO|nr:hypothetical protein LSUE1_G005616 [Lachnellula suecica]
MATIVDLTHDSSSDERPAVKNVIKQSRRTERQPLNSIQNNANPLAGASLSRPSPTMNPTLGPALTNTLSKASAERLRELLLKVCRAHLDAKALVEREFLVPRREVIPYHADTESEDAEESNDGSDDENASDSESLQEEAQELKYKENTENLLRLRGDRIYRTDEMWVSIAKQKRAAQPMPKSKRKADESVDAQSFARYAKCENCKEEFDVTQNMRGDCVWHEGEKELYDDDDLWADHDPDCHGEPSSFEDDPTFADGFQWTCCEKLGSEEGCKQTKHKAEGQPRKKSRHA